MPAHERRTEDDAKMHSSSRRLNQRGQQPHLIATDDDQRRMPLQGWHMYMEGIKATRVFVSRGASKEGRCRARMVAELGKGERQMEDRVSPDLLNRALELIQGYST